MVNIFLSSKRTQLTFETLFSVLPLGQDTPEHPFSTCTVPCWLKLLDNVFVLCHEPESYNNGSVKDARVYLKGILRTRWC